MKETAATPETFTSIQERLAEINSKHCETLNRLYEWEAARRMGAASDHYTSYDDTDALSDDARNVRVCC